MTVPLPPVPPSSDSHASPTPPGAGGQQIPPWSGEAAPVVQPGPSQSNTQWRQPAAIGFLGGFALIALGIVLAWTITGFLWAPWQSDAFLSTVSGGLTTYDIQTLRFVFYGIPLEVCGLVLGTTAALLLWSEVPSASRPRGSVRRPKRITFASWARIAGGEKAALLVVLLVALAFGCASFIMEAVHVL